MARKIVKLDIESIEFNCVAHFDLYKGKGIHEQDQFIIYSLFILNDETDDQSWLVDISQLIPALNKVIVDQLMEAE